VWNACSHDGAGIDLGGAIDLHTLDISGRRGVISKVETGGGVDDIH
jgi:hypothetical protein